MARSISAPTVSIGSAHQRRRCTRPTSTGGGSTLSIAVSSLEVSIRTILVAALGIAIVILFGRRNTFSNQQKTNASRISQLPTEYESTIDRPDLAKTGGKLIGGAVVTGAILAFILAIFVAVVVTSVTDFLQ